MNVALDWEQPPGFIQPFLGPAWIAANDGKSRVHHD